MDFLETLAAVGGVKPCSECTDGWYPVPDDMGRPGHARCQYCHGTGTVLDLAPLLAKPKELENVTKVLEGKLWEVAKGLIDDEGEFYVVGPQRAHSLVYEVARQLGGSAVVIIEEEYEE